MRHRGYKIPQPRVPVFVQACLAVVTLHVLWYVGSFIVVGLTEAIRSIL